MIARFSGLGPLAASDLSQEDQAVVAQLGTSAVDVNTAELIVERFGPDVAQLEVPVVALRGRDLDDERFVG